MAHGLLDHSTPVQGPSRTCIESNEEEEAGSHNLTRHSLHLASQILSVGSLEPVARPNAAF